MLEYVSLFHQARRPISSNGTSAYPGNGGWRAWIFRWRSPQLVASRQYPGSLRLAHPILSFTVVDSSWYLTQKGRCHRRHGDTSFAPEGVYVCVLSVYLPCYTGPDGPWQQHRHHYFTKVLSPSQTEFSS